MLEQDREQVGRRVRTGLDLVPAFSGGSVVGTDDQGPPEHHGGLRRPREGVHPRGQRAGRPGVVGVAQRHQLGVQVRPPRGPRGGQSSPPLPPHQLAVRGVVGVQPHRVDRAVVHDHHRARRRPLSQDPIQRLGQVRSPPVHRHHGPD